MEFPDELSYSKEHTWLRLSGENEGIIGITEFAQSELGEIVYVDLPNVGSSFKQDEVFGSVEALKTTSDLFMPVSGLILEINKAVVTNPGLVNTNFHSGGWMIKISLTNRAEIDSLLDAAAYRSLVS